MSPSDVEKHTTVDAVAVPRFLAEDIRRIVLRLHGDEPVVAAQAPAAGVPVHAAADVAGEERLGPVDAEAALLEQAQAADAGGGVRHHGTLARRREHDVAAVVERVGRLQVRRPSADEQVLCDAEGAAHFSLDADVPIQMDRDACAKVVVAEARPPGVLALREERAAAGNDGDDDGAWPRRRVLRVRLTGSDECHRCDKPCNPTRHDWPPVPSHVPYFRSDRTCGTIRQVPHLGVVLKRTSKARLPEETDLRLLDDAAVSPNAGYLENGR